MLTELLGKLKNLLSDIDAELQISHLPKDFLVQTRKITQQAVKKISEGRQAELLKAQVKARELLPQLKAVIKEQADRGLSRVMWDVPSDLPQMTHWGYFLETFPTRDDVGNALVQMLKDEGFDAEGRWIVQSVGAGYTCEYYRLWASW